MLWISLCILTAIIYAVSAFFDNYIVDVAFARRKPQAAKIFNGISYFFVVSIILLVKRDIVFPDLQSSLLLVFSGIIAALSSIPYYVGLQKEETTAASILEQMGPIIYLFANVLIFRERLEGLQILALILLLLAPLTIVLSHRQRRKQKNQLRTLKLFLIYVIIFTISGIIFARVGEGNDYWGCFVLFLLGRGLFDVTASLCRKDWQKDFKYVWKKRRATFLKAAIINQFLCMAAEFTSRRALILGDTAIASALMNSLELIFTFILGLILTLIWPRFGREKLERRTVFAHLIGVAACTVGILIINLTGS